METPGVVLKIELKARWYIFAVATKDLQTMNIKFGQVIFNSLVFTWERNFEVRFGIFSVLVSQINVVESYFAIYQF